MIRQHLSICAGLAIQSLAITTDAGVIAQWNLDQGSGTTVSPAVGPVTGTFNSGGNVTWQSGGPPITMVSPNVQPNNSLAFGGAVGDYINFPDNAVLEPGSITVAFWARASDTSFNNAGRVMLAKYDSFPGSWEFGFATASNFFFRTFVGGGDVFAGNTAGDPFTVSEFNDGGWHFIAGTLNATTAKTRLYVDGLLVEELTQNGGPINNTTAPMTLGQRSFPGAESPYKGSIGGPLTIWDEALSASEVFALIVPEPSTVVLLGLSALLLWRRWGIR